MADDLAKEQTVKRRRGAPKLPPTPTALPQKPFEHVALGFADRFAVRVKGQFHDRQLWEDFRQEAQLTALDELEKVCRRAGPLKGVTALEYVALRLSLGLMPRKGRSGRLRRLMFRALGAPAETKEERDRKLRELRAWQDELRSRLKAAEQTLEQTQYHWITTHEAVVNLLNPGPVEFPLTIVEPREEEDRP